jgi:hypothetical protein
MCSVRSGLWCDCLVGLGCISLGSLPCCLMF